MVAELGECITISYVTNNTRKGGSILIFRNKSTHLDLFLILLAILAPPASISIITQPTNISTNFIEATRATNSVVPTLQSKLIWVSNQLASSLFGHSLLLNTCFSATRKVKSESFVMFPLLAGVTAIWPIEFRYLMSSLPTTTNKRR